MGLKKIHTDLASYVSYSMLFPNATISFKHLINQIKEFDLRETILVLAKLNVLMSNRKYAINSSFQNDLSGYFLNNYSKEKLISFLKKSEGTFFLFHRHQLLFLLKNVFLYCGKSYSQVMN